MEAINQILRLIGKMFEWWVIVMPWESAVFVRLGKKSKILNGGLYLKIPFIDRVYIQATRTRAVDFPIQTVTTIDGRPISIKVMATYSINNIEKMFRSIQHPEMILSGIVMGGISEYVRLKSAVDVNAEDTEKFVLEKMKSVDYGFGDISVKITSWADVKTFRLIQDQSWISEGLSMNYIGEKKES